MHIMRLLSDRYIKPLPTPHFPILDSCSIEIECATQSKVFVMFKDNEILSVLRFTVSNQPKIETKTGNVCQLHLSKNFAILL